MVRRTVPILTSPISIAGPANSTIGWGYSITNPSATQWLVITGLSAGTFVNGSPDSSYFDFPDLDSRAGELHYRLGILDYKSECDAMAGHYWLKCRHVCEWFAGQFIF